MRRLTWLVGPPGAGKTSYAASLPSSQRVVELTEMLGPLVNPVRMRKGILGANGLLVRLIRQLELHPDHQELPPLVVVAGLVPEDALFPLDEREEVLLLLPERQRWHAQLHQRPVGTGSSQQYDDYGYAAVWYERFSRWVEQGLPCRTIPVPFRPELVGLAPPGH